MNETIVGIPSAGLQAEATWAELLGNILARSVGRPRGRPASAASLRLQRTSSKPRPSLILSFREKNKGKARWTCGPWVNMCIYNRPRGCLIGNSLLSNLPRPHHLGGSKEQEGTPSCAPNSLPHYPAPVEWGQVSGVSLQLERRPSLAKTVVLRIGASNRAGARCHQN